MTTEQGPEMYWDDQREVNYFHCECITPEPIEDVPWVPVECGECGGRL